MRPITRVIIHCTASDDEADNRDHALTKLHIMPPDIEVHWNNKQVNCFGFDSVGYHFVVWKTGDIQNFRDLEEMGAHVKGHNGDSVGVCLAGLNDFSPFQMRQAAKLVWELCQAYGLDPLKDVHPHNKYTDKKTCPNFPLEKLFKHYPKYDVDPRTTHLANQVARFQSQLSQCHEAIYEMNQEIIEYTRKTPVKHPQKWWEFWK